MKNKKQILKDEKAPVLVLLSLVTKEYGKECYDWDPLVLKAELQEDFDLELSDLQSDKIQAGITILTTDQYETNVPVFETLNYLSKEKENNVLICYFKINDVLKLKSLKIENSILTEVHPEQQNIIQFNDNGSKSSLLLSGKTTKGMLK